jgi:signal transduction histidine kinase
MIMDLLGYFSLDTVGLYAFQVGSIISVLSFQMVISGQVHRKLTEQRENKQKMILADQKLAQETQARHVQEQFLAMLTHEIKSPLSIINMLMLDIDQTSPYFREGQKAVEDIVSVLEISKMAQWLEQDQMNLNLEKVNLFAVFEDCMAKEKKHADRLMIEHGLKTDYIVEIDSLILKIIISNLIDNAVKYGSDSIITISLFEDHNLPNYVGFSVVNEEGICGHPLADQVYNKFYRNPKALRKTGSGLGLYVVKALVDRVGGRIEYQYQNGFITFTVFIKKCT